MTPKATLTLEQRRMYGSEKEENFRWLLKIAATQSKYVLSSKDLVSTSLQQELSEIGQFMEVAHGSMDPERVWQYLPELTDKGSPLDGYTFLEDSELLSVFHGSVARLQGYVAYKPDTRQLIVAFSGTSSGAQALYDLSLGRTNYPYAEEDGKGAAAHGGFWKLYKGVRDDALKATSAGLNSKDVSELVITGHSMGGAMSYLFTLELLRSSQQAIRVPFGLPIKFAVFGCPRVGNAALVKCWRARVEAYRNLHGEEKFQEWSVKAFNDGVPCLPAVAIGYRHFTSVPMYLYQGSLYRIPGSESEHSKFVVEPPPEGTPQVPDDFPLGGHNYYGGRDMEKVQRLMRWATELGLGQNDDWKAAFKKRLDEEDERWKAKLAKKSG